MNRRGLLKLFGIAPLAAATGKQEKVPQKPEVEVDRHGNRFINCTFSSCPTGASSATTLRIAGVYHTV